MGAARLTLAGGWGASRCSNQCRAGHQHIATNAAALEAAGAAGIGEGIAMSTDRRAVTGPAA